jgi:hypothetical protein
LHSAWRVTLFFQTSLFQDTVSRAGCQIVTQLAGDRDPTGLRAMLQLAVTSALHHFKPTVVLQESHDVAHFHLRDIPGPNGLRPTANLL